MGTLKRHNYSVAELSASIGELPEIVLDLLSDYWEYRERATDLAESEGSLNLEALHYLELLRAERDAVSELREECRDYRDQIESLYGDIEELRGELDALKEGEG